MQYRTHTRASALASLVASYDAIEAAVAANCGTGKRFADVTARDHVEDITAELVRLDPSLLVDIEAFDGPEDGAIEMIEVALMGLYAHNRDLFEKPITDLKELWRLTIKTQGGDPDRDPAPKGDYEGKIGRRDESELWFWIRDRMDWTERRRWQYDLRKQAAAKAKAKRAKKADAHE